MWVLTQNFVPGIYFPSIIVIFTQNHPRWLGQPTVNFLSQIGAEEQAVIDVQRKHCAEQDISIQVDDYVLYKYTSVHVYKYTSMQ